MFKNILTITFIAIFFTLISCAESIKKEKEERAQEEIKKAHKYAELKAQGCFDQQTLRVKMGDTLLALPRRIRSFYGPDADKESTTEYYFQVCQKPTDTPLELEKLDLNIYTKSCRNLGSDKECIHTDGILFTKKFQEERGYFKDKDIKDLKICHKSKSCKKYCSVGCKHAFKYKNLIYRFELFLKYKNEEKQKLFSKDIQYVEKEILEKLKSYDITPPLEER